MTTREPEKRSESQGRAGLRWLAKSLGGTVFMGALLFWVAGRVDWLMGWVYLAIFVAVSVASVQAVVPELLRERSGRHANVASWDKALLPIYSLLGWLVTPLLAALQLRLQGRLSVASWLQVLGMVVYGLGWALHLWAMAVNRFFAKVVRLQEDRGQEVATQGPYAWVRHPGYTGAALSGLGLSFFLGSTWAMIPAALSVGLIILRTVLEDRLLRQELAGYGEYASAVRYRLIPGIW